MNDNIRNTHFSEDVNGVCESDTDITEMCRRYPTVPTSDHAMCAISNDLNRPAIVNTRYCAFAVAKIIITVPRAYLPRAVFISAVELRLTSSTHTHIYILQDPDRLGIYS